MPEDEYLIKEIPNILLEVSVESVINVTEKQPLINLEFIIDDELYHIILDEEIINYINIEFNNLKNEIKNGEILIKNKILTIKKFNQTPVKRVK